MHDTLIIGAGLSGLAAGIRLAYFERKVVVLERHTTVGGLNSFYRLRGRNYDVGLHAVTNYAAPGTKTGPLSKLLRQLRLSWDDFALAPQRGSRVCFPGAEVEFANDFEAFCENVVRAFPKERDRFRRLCARILAHDELDLLQPSLSARRVLNEELRDPTLIDLLFCPLMFYGSATPGDMEFQQFVVMFKSIYREGFGRPRAGVRQIMKAVTRKYKESGGELRLRCGVRRLRHDGRRVVEVELDSGECLSARQVLSSAGLCETLRLCDPPLVDRPMPQPGAISFVEAIFSLGAVQPAQIGIPHTITFFNNDPRGFRYDVPDDPVDVSSGIICSPNNFQYDAPLDEGMLRLTALAQPRFWLTPRGEEEYQAEKGRWRARMVEAARRWIPDFTSYVVDVDMFTPRTIVKYTGHENGAVYGAPQKELQGRTPLENLFVCGTDQGFLGITGSMLSGITIANLHLLRAPN